MKKKTVFTILPAAVFSAVLLVIFACAAYFYSTALMIAELIAAGVAVVVTFICFALVKLNVSAYFSSAARTVQGTGSGTLAGFILPIMVTNAAGEITWYNENFRSSLLLGNDIFAEPSSMFFNDNDIARLQESGKTEIGYNDRKYKVFAYHFDEDKNSQHMYFFIDNTDNYRVAQMYRKSRPCVMFIHVDGLDIMLKNALESQKTEIKGEIEKQIEMITNVASGYLQKISSKSYLLVTDYQGFEAIKADKFSVLSNVRALSFGDRGAASLSIGVGLGGESLAQCAEFADNALDMALGRGGDQAVIKNKDEFSFFGGVTQTAQVNSRVRTRVISATLRKLIENSENVLIMGHSYSDMDAFGSAYALCCAVRKMDRPSKIVIDEEHSLARPLINYVAHAAGAADFLATPHAVLPHIGRKTLLIITDTHRRSFLESREVYEKSPSVVVIDHHRQTVDFIDNSLLFYHDPSASSASEMVTELLQYMGSDLVGKTQAEALLAGIALDTNNFVVKTGTRTFEASAYLRSRGADPVNVKRLFADSLDTYTSRANIVANAVFYKNFALSVCPTSCKNAQIAASQAADELLTIQNVSASFVMYKDGGAVHISARSFGASNVQLIMERLGGGGHQTMAAAQLESSSFDDAKTRLIAALDEYLADV